MIKTIMRGAQVEKKTPDLLQFCSAGEKSGGRDLMITGIVIGLPLLVVYAIIYISAGRESFNMSGDISQHEGAIKGLLYIVAGIIAVIWGALTSRFGKGQFFRQIRLVIDRKQMNVAVVRRSPFWVSRKEYPLEGLKSLVLFAESYKEGSWFLDISHHDTTLRLGGDDQVLLRKTGEEIAKFVNLPLIERTSSGDIERTPSDLDIPLMKAIPENFKMTGSEAFAVPADLALSIEKRGQEVLYHFHQKGMKVFLGYSLFLLIMVGIIPLTFILRIHNPNPKAIQFMTMMTGFFLFISLPYFIIMFVTCFTHRDLLIDPHNITESTFLAGKKRLERKIPLSGVEDVRMDSGTDVLIVSDTAIFKTRNLNMTTGAWLRYSLIYNIREAWRREHGDDA